MEKGLSKFKLNERQSKEKMDLNSYKNYMSNITKERIANYRLKMVFKCTIMRKGLKYQSINHSYKSTRKARIFH